MTGFAITADAAEVKIISGPATDAVLAAVRPQFERDTGNTFTSKGGVTGVLKRLIESGEPFDLAIIPGPLMDSFVKQGKIAAGTSTPLVRVGMGVAVRAGAAKPDISTVAKFKKAILDAKSVTYVPTGETATRLAGVLDRLGIADQVRAKTQLQPNVPAAIQAVASGKAELYFSLTNIIATAKGIELAGPFPPELQHYLVINTGIGTAAKQPDAAKALVKLLMSPSADAAIKAGGLERARK
ncbi:MAG TPA: substrate-binding domain-containing protein [Pseudolabrys sp.]